MASYFDLPPQDKAVTAASIEAVPEKERENLGGMSFLSPAVTQLLEDIGQEKSDSNSEEGSFSENSGPDQGTPNTKHVSNNSRPETARTTSKAGKAPSSPRKGDHSSTSKSGRASQHSERTKGGSSLKPKQPRMARFHSLRSMLFTSAVEEKMQKVKEEESQNQLAAERWRSQYNQRQMNRPNTPEKEAQGKEKLASRLKTKMRRITSKEPSTLDSLNEDGGAHDFSGSTASSDADEDEPESWRRHDDDESINHSDVEDLVRWVSRRDPPSDGEARADRKTRAAPQLKEDSGHESLGQSDVDDLVRWVSHRSEAPQAEEVKHTGYSDASTESDSELGKGHVSSEDEDADDLVRWISHRDGPIAGPIRRRTPKSPPSTDAHDHIAYDSDVPELGRWVTRRDATSGESAATSPVREIEDPLEPERGRPRSRDRPLSRNAKNHLTDDDIGDLVRWVSRNDSKQQESPVPDQAEADDELKALRRQEQAKQHAIGMSVDEGSLSHSDVKEILQHVQSNKMSALPNHPGEDLAVLEHDEQPRQCVVSTSIDEESLSHRDATAIIENVQSNNTSAHPNIEVLSVPMRPGAGESGALKRENTSIRNSKKPAAQEYLQRSRAERQQMYDDAFPFGEDGQVIAKTDKKNAGDTGNQNRDREGSLGQEDIDELVRWVSQKN